MSLFSAYALTGMALFALGLFGVFFLSHLLRRLMALNIMSMGVFLLLTALSLRNADPNPDPVPHAMLLTGTVVAISATAFAVALVRKYFRVSGECDLEEGEA